MPQRSQRCAAATSASAYPQRQEKGRSVTAEEWSATRLSLLVAAAAVCGSLPFAIPIAFLLARWRSPVRSLLETLVSLPLVLPPVVTGYLLLLAFGRRGPIGAFLEQTFGLRVTFTWLGAALAAAVVGFPLMVRAIRLAFDGIDPRLEAAARGLGAGRWDAFVSVSLPLALPGVVSGAVLAFARSLGEFGATILVAGNIPGQTRTIPLAIFTEVNRPDGMPTAARLVVLSILLALAALLVSERLERRAHG